MKNNKGFTLLEMLAILVVLAFITIITVPAIGNIIEKTKKNTSTESAYGYIEALKEHMATLPLDGIETELEGTYVITNGNISGYNLETQTIKTKGKKPTNGYIIYSENVIQQGCLTIGDYKVTLNNKKVESIEKGACEVVASSNTLEPVDVTGGLRERVLTLYASEIADAKNYFIVYRNNFESADLILYYNSNFTYQLQIVEPNDSSTDIPYWRLYIPESCTGKINITMSENGENLDSCGPRYYTGRLQFWDSNQNHNIEMFGYPSNINNFQTYKKLFGKVITESNYETIKLDEVLTLPSSYNNTTCRDYMVLTYNSNAQFYCITGDAGFTYNPSNKQFTFNYNNSHMYRFKYDSNWDIVFDRDMDWTYMLNDMYKNYDILDLIVLSTFDIKDSNNNIVYPKNTTIEKLTTNYVAQ